MNQLQVSLNVFNLTDKNRDVVYDSSFLEFFDAVIKVNSLHNNEVQTLIFLAWTVVFLDLNWNAFIPITWAHRPSYLQLMKSQHGVMRSFRLTRYWGTDGKHRRVITLQVHTVTHILT